MERVRPTKNVPQLSNEPTLLGSAVAAAVHGRTEDLFRLIVEYFLCDRTQDMSRLAELLLGTLGEIHIREEPTDRERQIIERASEELRRSHRQFRAAMTWLCSPKYPAPSALPNLKPLGSGKSEPGRYPQVDKKSEKFIHFFETHGLRHFRMRLSLQDGRLVPFPRIVHLVDLFCACILDRCLGRKVPEMPIKICPTCRKLFLSERRQFCSKDCQWKHYWTPDRRSDDKWIKDLERFSKACKPKYGRPVADLQKKLASPKVTQRLKSIKEKTETEDWTGWTRIAQRIEAIEKRGAKSGWNG